MRKVAFHTLGCKVNIYETEAMQRLMSEAGYELVNFNENADVYIINTCSVTNIADRKSRQILHRAKKENPDSVVVAAGCYVQSGAEKIKQDCNIDIIVGNNKKKDIAIIINKYFDEVIKLNKLEHQVIEEAIKENSDELAAYSKKSENIERRVLSNVIDINKSCEYEDFGVSKLGRHTRAFIKVQDGCNQFCTYCIIPYTRGRIRSRELKSILAEVSGLVKKGYKEMVLTGIHLSSYGLDVDRKQQLLELISAVAGIPGVERLRIGSLEPRIISREFLSGLIQIPQFCPHFHLSLQSGCDSVLKRMNRQYNSSDFIKGVKLIREYYRHPAITTDIIVGFPGESEEEFNISRDFVNEVGFYEMHIFPFSVREGTKAAKLPNQLTQKEKSVRAAILAKINKEKAYDFRKHCLGQFDELLSEEVVEINGRKYIFGHTKEYVKAAVPYFAEGQNKLIKGRLTSFLTEEILLMEPTVST